MTKTNTTYGIDLQLFADAGSLVNGTAGFVNASTGVTSAFDTTNTLAPELKSFYDTELLENARAEMVYAQLAKRQPLPANHHGAYTAITDTLELRAYDDVILGATEEMGASAAETQEKLIRDALLLGTNVLYCDNIDLGTNEVLGTPTSCAEMAAGGTAKNKYNEDYSLGWSLMSPSMVNKAVTIMKKNRVPRINGRYYAVVHPSVAHDLRQWEGWIEAHKYAAPEELFNGEIGELHGVRFIENSFAPVLGVKGATAEDDDSYVNQERGRTYATYFFGKDAFGIIDPEGGALEMIIHDKGEIGGPLNQFSTIGYKFETNGATILYPERLLRVMSVSSFSATDEVN